MKGRDFSYNERNKGVDSNKEELPKPVFKVGFYIFLPNKHAAVSVILNDGRLSTAQMSHNCMSLLTPWGL